MTFGLKAGDSWLQRALFGGVDYHSYRSSESTTQRIMGHNGVTKTCNQVPITQAKVLTTLLSECHDPPSLVAD